MSSQRLWTTKDGRNIRIADMDDKHLRNTIRFLERRCKEEFNRAIANPPYFIGDMAQFCADQEYDALCENGWEGLLPCIYYDMQQEASNRGIKSDA